MQKQNPDTEMLITPDTEMLIVQAAHTDSKMLIVTRVTVSHADARSVGCAGTFASQNHLAGEAG
jgi:hypothetical protein